MSDDRILNWASWTSTTTGLVSLCRDWRGRRLPPLTFGEERSPLRRLAPAQLSFYGEVAGYYVDQRQLVFFLRPQRHGLPELDKESVYVAGNFSGWGNAIGQRRWQLQPESVDGAPALVLRTSLSRVLRQQPVLFKFVTGHGHWLHVPDHAPNVHIDEQGNRNFRLWPQRTGRHLFRFTTPLPLNLASDRRLIYNDGQHEESQVLQPGVFLKQMESDLPLGPRIEGGRTVFRLFAPQASSVRLYLYDTLEDDQPSPIYLNPNRGLVWEATVGGNRHGSYYYYRVDGESHDSICHFDAQMRILDPYALAVVGPQGPGIVIDAEHLPRPEQPFQPPALHDLVILEAHVRDLTTHAPVPMSPEERRGFTGLCKWLEREGHYVARTGVNALELQPIQAYDDPDPERYAWGYMPVNYFSPAPQYGLDPLKASQIEEFAALVETCHRQGIAVIIDVVYNHVGEPNHLQFLDKQYYFLLNEEGEHHNYTGTGNTLDADAPMVRRLFRDSLVHLVEVFDVDGFRFDLGEILGKDCLAWLHAELRAVKPGILFVGEPWSFRGHIADQLRETDVSSWNDGYREFVRDYVRGQGNVEGLRYFLTGSPHLARFPAQTINYTESHDDRCWIDKITENADFNGEYPTFNDRRRTHLMIAVLMMSLGTPMLSSGQDLLKSKQGVNNTYLDGPRNALDYERAARFPATQLYCRNWVRLRLSEVGRLLRHAEHPPEGYFRFWNHHSALVALYNANEALGATRLLFTVNPHFETLEIETEASLDRPWRLLADAERCDLAGLPEPLPPQPGQHTRLLPLSCALWIEG